jgi:hypothetical protein
MPDAPFRGVTHIASHFFPRFCRYYLFVAYLFVPFFSLANSYAAGLTDQDNYRCGCASGAAACRGMPVASVCAMKLQQPASQQQQRLWALHQPAAQCQHAAWCWCRVSSEHLMHPPCSVYGQFAIFIFAAWAGTSNGGVIAGLAICGVVVAAVSQAAVLMQVGSDPQLLPGRALS